MRRKGTKKSIGRFARSRRGVAGVEFALVMPILLFLMIGAIEIGRGLRDYHVVSESVRDAARFLSRRPVDCAAAPPDFVNITDELAGAYIVMTGNPVPSPGDDLLGYWNHTTNAADVTVTITCFATGADWQGLYNGFAQLPIIEVMAEVPFDYLFGSFISSSPTATFTLRHTVVNVGQ